MQQGIVYLIPSALHTDDNAILSLPVTVLHAVKDCQVFFVENERSARRFLKKIYPEIVIDDQIWYTIHKAENEVVQQFISHLKAGQHVAIISEAGCAGVADPGQLLVAAAHKIDARIIPVTGPSAILLALMASGMNGQCFQFNGYLPLTTHERKSMLRTLEADSAKRNCTQMFIETPYRNNQLLQDILQVCNADTFICIAADLTAAAENIQTKPVRMWKNSVPDLHKRPVIFLLYAGNK